MVYETRYSDSLTHHGIKGQKWGVRRYQNPDGTLTAKGKKRYRKDYDRIRYDQIASENAKTVGKTGIPFIDNYNSSFYSKRAQHYLKLLAKQIGDRGLSDLDADVVREGKAVAEKARKNAEDLNKWMNESFDMGIEDNWRFLRDSQYDYDRVYKEYVQDKLVRR